VNYAAKPTPIKQQRRCPYCGELLRRAGKIVDVGTHTTWVEQWECSAHGVIPPGPDESKYRAS